MFAYLHAVPNYDRTWCKLWIARGCSAVALQEMLLEDFRVQHFVSVTKQWQAETKESIWMHVCNLFLHKPWLGLPWRHFLSLFLLLQERKWKRQSRKCSCSNFIGKMGFIHVASVLKTVEATGFQQESASSIFLLILLLLSTQTISICIDHLKRNHALSSLTMILAQQDKPNGYWFSSFWVPEQYPLEVTFLLFQMCG